jgi:SAM-dependent methyltransferase
MKLHRLRCHSDFVFYKEKEAVELEKHMATINRYIPKCKDSFTVEGYSYTAAQQVKFLVDFQHAGAKGEIIWRERVCCPITGFNNRMRATFHIFDIEMEAYQDSNIYVTEQVTPIYSHFAKNYSNVIGSEYLGDQIPYGKSNSKGIRNETLCDLQFPSESFDIVVSLDVLEHIPDYRTAFLECCRVIKKGGRFLWSVPFVPHSENNIVCAEMRDGKVHHIIPAQYHGDPLSNEGVLCFTYFGWEMLEQMRSTGFTDAYAVAYHSLQFGYLGGVQFIFIAHK